MTLAQALLRVRQALNQTSNSNTLWTDANITDELEAGRRYFATILDDKYLSKLRKTSSAITLTGGVGAYPTDFLRLIDNGYATFTSVVLATAVPMVRLPEDERWRLRFFNTTDQVFATPQDTVAESNPVYWETSGGIRVLPVVAGGASSILYEYIFIPTALTTNDDELLGENVNDMVIEYAIEAVMRSTRGDQGLALSLAKNRGYKVREMQSVIS